MNLNKMIRSAKQYNDLIAKPIIEDWLLRHGDDPFPDWVNQELLKVMSTKPRDRSGSFSGSAAGTCLRMQELGFAGLQGGAIDPQLQNIFNDGKWRHLRWQGMLLTTGLATDIEYLVRWREHLSRGSVDARGVVRDDHPRVPWRGKEVGYEAKGWSTFQFQKLKAEGIPYKHNKQIHHYFVLGCFDLFSYIAEDKTTQEIHEIVIEPDPQMIQEAEDDIWELSKAVKTKTLHGVKPACLQRKGSEYNDCPFGRNGKCLAANTDVPPPFVRSI